MNTAATILVWHSTATHPVAGWHIDQHVWDDDEECWDATTSELILAAETFGDGQAEAIETAERLTGLRFCADEAEMVMGELAMVGQ